MAAQARWFVSSLHTLSKLLCEAVRAIIASSAQSSAPRSARWSPLPSTEVQHGWKDVTVRILLEEWQMLETSGVRKLHCAYRPCACSSTKKKDAASSADPGSPQELHKQQESMNHKEALALSCLRAVWVRAALNHIFWAWTWCCFGDLCQCCRVSYSDMTIGQQKA